MQTVKPTAATSPRKTAEGKPLNLQKRLGSTTYLVSVHFSQESKETLQDKLMRLIEREVSDV